MQNRTLFGGISLVPGGSAWIFQKSEVRKTSYFLRNEWERQPELGEEEFYGKLDETLTRILPRYFGGGQRVGMSLTGGLDSRMILACYPPPPSALPCYTFAGMIREAEDVRLSRRIASFCSQSYEVISLNQEFFRNFPKLAAQSVYLTDGALDVTGSSGLYTNGIAREIAPVRLTGHYGGEVLRGNIVLRPDRVDRQMISIDLASHLDHQISAYRKNIDPSSTSFVVFKQVPWHHFARLAMEQTQLTVRSPYLDNEIVALAFQAPNSEAVNKRIACRLVVTKNNALSEIPTDFGLLGKPGVRSELRRKYQGFIHRAEYAYDYGMPNWMAKIDNALSFLRPERLFLGRHKYCHFRIWYKTELSQCVRDILLDPSTLSRSYLNAARVQQIVETHLSGQQNHTLAIHKLLTSQLIERHLLKAT